MSNFGCRCCMVPHAEDPDLFDGREFCAKRPLLPADTSASLSMNNCSGSATNDEEIEVEAIEATGADIFSEERRNVVARGMKRFEIDKFPPPQPDFEIITPRVCYALAQNPGPFTLNGTNCYLVGTGKKRILIDTGESDRGNVEFLSGLESLMAEVGCTGLDMILVTHLHGDHFGGVDMLLERFGPVPVMMLKCPDWQISLFTMFMLEQKGLIPYLEAGPSPRNPDNTFNNFSAEDIPDWPDEDLSWDPAGRTKVELQREYYFMKRHINFYRAWYLKEGLYVNSRPLVDGEILTTEGATLKVMHTPGHAENHACFILLEEESLLSGDHVLGYGTTVMSDLKTYMQSLQMMLDLKPKRLYPGHGPHIQDGTGLLSRYIVHRQSREDQVVDHMKQNREPLRSVDIVDALYLDTPAERKKMARENIDKILLKLYRDERALCFKEGTKYKLPGNLYMRRIETDITWQLSETSNL